MKIKLTLNGSAGIRKVTKTDAYRGTREFYADDLSLVIDVDEFDTDSLIEGLPTVLEGLKSSLESSLDDIFVDGTTTDDNGRRDDCYVDGCHNTFPDPTGQRLYCDVHQCTVPRCDNSVEDDSRFCYEHECSEKGCHRVSIGGDDELCHVHASAAGTNPFASETKADFGITK